MLDKKLLIIGGGPTGCSAAAYALKKGFENVTLIESSNSLGGLHKDLDINGLHYDLGAFFFWKDHNMLTLFPGIQDMLVQAESERHLSLTQCFNVDSYPITLKMYLRENGYTNFILDILNLVFIRVLYSEKKCKNVDDLLRYYMGPFYRKSGLKYYIQRLYNMHPSNVSTELAKKRLKPVVSRFKFVNIIKSILQAKWSNLSRYQLSSGTWARPESGFGTLYEHIESELIKSSCSLRLGEAVIKIDLQKKTVNTNKGHSYDYDYLFSTQSPELTGKMANLRYEGLMSYQPLCSLFYESPISIMNECFVLFNFTNFGKWKRITFHSNYYNRNSSSEKQDRHYFVVESMPSYQDRESTNVADILDQDFKSSFSGSNFEMDFTNANLVGHHLTPNAYPIFDLNFDSGKISDFKRMMESYDVYLVGRQGEFDHISSSDSSKRAVEVINVIVEKNNSCKYT